MDVKAALVGFVEDYLKSNCIPVHHVTLPCSDYSWLDYGLRRAIPNSGGYRPIQHYFESVGPGTIYHLQDMFFCVYTIFCLPDSEELMVCGPVMFGDESFPARAAEEKVLFLTRSIPAIQDFYQQVTVFHQSTAYYNIFKQLGPLIYGKDLCKVVYHASRIPEFISDFFHLERESLAEPSLRFYAVEKWFSMEAELAIAVCKGKEDDILNVMSRVQSTPLPPVLPDTAQNIQACMITLDTLLRKAVELSGVPPIFIDPCVRRHVHLISQTTNRPRMDTLLAQFIRDYQFLLHQQSLKQYSLLTQKIITLIRQDITADLSLNTISEKINANAKYVSALFKREVGITLTDYVTKQRMELAKQMLLYTDYPIKTIAQSCGIPDIHYFSHLFKRRIGCTPKFYRENQFADDDFQN